MGMKKQLTHDDLIALLRRRIKECGSQKLFAAVAGISEQYVSDVLRGRREPGDAILSALGLQKAIYYEQREG
jgi:transcriptional regulator with XRE-family HTH domain